MSDSYGYCCSALTISVVSGIFAISAIMIIMIIGINTSELLENYIAAKC